MSKSILFSLLLFSISVVGQKKNVIFEKYDVEKGLSSNWVRDIAQDKQGYIWLATSDGLNRFDGYNFKVYHHDEKKPNSLLVNHFHCLFVDTENILWLGYNGGISKYDPIKDDFAHFTNSPNNLNSIASNKISDITCDSKSNLWIASRDKGICTLDKSTYNFKSYKYKGKDEDQLNSQYVIHCDRKDRLWIGTYSKGVLLFDINTKKYTSYSNQNSFDGCFTTSLFEDKDGKIWVGTDRNGLLYYDEKTNSFIRHSSIPLDKMIISINEDVERNLWVSVENTGLYIINTKDNTVQNIKHNKFISNGIGHNSVNSILKDINGNMWLGTFSSGVNFCKFPNNRFGHVFNDPISNNTLSHNSVLCFTEDSDKNLWIGTDDGGLNKYNNSTQKFELYEKSNRPGSISTNVILSLKEDKNKNLWVGTYNEGLFLFNKNTGSFIKKIPDYSFGSMVEDSEANFWLGGWREGLFLYNRTNNTYRKYSHVDNDPTSLSDNFVFYVYEDRKKNIWVCTSVGLNLLEDKEKGKFRRFLNDPGNPKSIANNTIYHCYEDTKGRLWVGTGGGLCELNRDSLKFKTYNEKDGLANGNVMGILEDDNGNLWLSTNRGMSCFNPETKQFKNYNKSDGLQSDQFNLKAQYKLSSGELLFGGTNGYNRFHPNDIKINKNIPNVVIKSLQAFNNTVIEKDKIKTVLLHPKEDVTVQYSQSNFIFDFVAFNYTNTKKVQYAYKLEGFDTDWIFTDNTNPVNYTNLNPGTYTFKVKATNEDGIWNETGAQIKIIIETPIWYSSWFWITIAAIVITLVYLLYRRKFAEVANKNKQLEGKVKETTTQIKEHKEKIDSLKKQLEAFTK